MSKDNPAIDDNVCQSCGGTKDETCVCGLDVSPDTLMNWRFVDGRILGPPVPNGKEYVAQSEVIAVIPMELERGSYTHYSRDLAEKHGRIIAELPALLTIVRVFLENTAATGTLDLVRQEAGRILDMAGRL